MNSRKQKILMAAMVFAAAANALGARAADQNAFFEQQREISDGYYPQYPVKEPSSSATASADASLATKTAAVSGPAQAETAQFEAFERQWGQVGDWTDYTPSEHASDGR